MNDYQLRATGVQPSQNPDLVAFVADRKAFKDAIWQRRNDKLVDLNSRLSQLISIYEDSGGVAPQDLRKKSLFYKSALAHQVWNILQGSKFEPDFIDFAPLGNDYDDDLRERTKALTDAHRLVRYRGGYERAKKAAKSDLIWGNSFIEMSTKYEGDVAVCTEYTHAPFREIRNFYGDSDILRVIDYSISAYAEQYGEEMLLKVSLGGILDTQSYGEPNEEKKEYDSGKEIIQVVRYYDPARLMFVEIHGGGGYIYKELFDNDYPFQDENGNGYSPFKESRFYEEVSGDYFGWGVMDYIIDLANLETTITNATAAEAIWEASSPSFVYSNDPDDLERKLKKHVRNINRGINMPIVQKSSGVGTSGKIESLRKGVDNQNMQVWDEVTVSRATRFSNVDIRAMSEYAPTAEQQKLKKLEADKLNMRVLLLNEEREKEFAQKEMMFLQNGKTKFQDYEVAVVDEVALRFQTEDGYIPTKKMKIKDILAGVKDVELKIAPRMEGVLDDLDFMEIQTMREDLALFAPGTAAYDIALEKYFEKKSPDWGLDRTQFSSPTGQPAQAPMTGGAGGGDPTQAMTQQLSAAV